MTRICVYGEGHLADATAAGCLAKGFDLVGLQHADLIWFCVNTPVDENDRPNTSRLLDQLFDVVENSDCSILISSQLPVGTMALWESVFRHTRLAYQPENIRKAHAKEDFLRQERMIVGTRHPEDIELITSVLEQFTPAVLVMSPESAEMVKHTLNTYLAMCIAFANEIGDICATVGAETDDVFTGFRTDRRVSDFAPLEPGGPYAGGTLGRDVSVLIDSFFQKVNISLILGIPFSNNLRTES